ncbi:MAG TPA: tetratricopeptide repeat protein [Thermoanaerobaculia bacterium]
MALRDRHAYRACVEVAREGLGAFPTDGSEAERAAAASVWLIVHDGLEPLGVVGEARQAIERALALTSGGTGPEALFAAAGAQLLMGRALMQGGDHDEARSRFEEAAAAFGKAGHTRERAVAMGEIADILQARGQLDEALRIRREEELPVHEALGDVRERAVTLGRIADVLAARGQLDEALRIHREEELPVYEALGDVRSLLVARTKLALNLQSRSRPGDLEEAHSLLTLALEAAERLRIPEAQTIRQILARAMPGSP